MIASVWMFAIKLVGISVICFWLLEKLVKYNIGSTMYTSFHITPQMGFQITYAFIGITALWILSMVATNMKWGK